MDETVREPLVSETDASKVAAKRLVWDLILIYVLGSTVAVAVTMFLILIGLEFTADQWMAMLMLLPVCIQIYIVPDIYLIVLQSRPIRDALELIGRGVTPEQPMASKALAQALNLPFLSFIRVTFFHGPAAAFSAYAMTVLGNYFFDADFSAWQQVGFVATVFFFAAPTHAICEFFAISRRMEKPIGQLWPYCRRLEPAHQASLISIPLKSKLIYLAVFVTTLPIIYLAFSIIYKADRLIEDLGLKASLDDVLPLWIWIAGVVGVCILGALAMSMLTAAEVSRSATRMADAMHQIEDGDLDVQLDVTGTDEYADLYRGFNLMTEGLRDEVEILEITNSLSGELKLDALIERIMSGATMLLGADRSTLFLYDSKTDELWSRFAQGLKTTDIRIPASAGIAGAVFQSREIVNIPDAYLDPRFNAAVDKATNYRTKSILCMPIVNKAGVAIGVTQTINKYDGMFTQKDEARLRAFTVQAAISLENAQLFDDVLQIKNHNESILKSTTDGIITLDEDDNILSANEAALSILEMSEDALVGRTATAHFEGQNDWLLRAVHRSQESRRAETVLDASLAVSDAETVSVNLTVTPLIGLSAENIGSMISFEDITTETRVRATMSRYMSPEVAEQLMSGGDAALDGKNQFVSILFSDVRGFTTMAESLGATETVSMLNEYFEIMVDVILKHDGILDKYIGDAIMSLFGAPFTSDNDADNAIATATEMIVQLRALNARRRRDQKEAIHIGIGVSSGDVVLGNIGSPKRLEYTVIGDNVNLSARLESATKFYRTNILISEFTVAAMTRDAALREIDFIRVKGKNKPVGIYEILGHHTGESFPNMAEVVGNYKDGMALYRARDWNAAIRQFESALRANADDGPSQIHLERCRQMLASPPPADWDGVWTMTTK